MKLNINSVKGSWLLSFRSIIVFKSNRTRSVLHKSSQNGKNFQINLPHFHSPCLYKKNIRCDKIDKKWSQMKYFEYSPPDILAIGEMKTLQTKQHFESGNQRLKISLQKVKYYFLTQNILKKLR